MIEEIGQSNADYVLRKIGPEIERHRFAYDDDMRRHTELMAENEFNRAWDYEQIISMREDVIALLRGLKTRIEKPHENPWIGYVPLPRLITLEMEKYQKLVDTIEQSK